MTSDYNLCKLLPECLFFQLSWNAHVHNFCVSCPPSPPALWILQTHTRWSSPGSCHTPPVGPGWFKHPLYHSWETDNAFQASLKSHLLMEVQMKKCCLPFQSTMNAAHHQANSHCSCPQRCILRAIQGGENRFLALQSLRCTSKE